MVPPRLFPRKALLPKGLDEKAGNPCHFLVTINFRVARIVIDFFLGKKLRSREIRGRAHSSTVGVAAAE